MNFIKAMKEAGVAFQTDGLGIRIINHLLFKNGFKLSVQCSQHHYCTPRALVDIEEYTEFEVAVFKDGNFYYPEELLRSFPKKRELDECHDGTIFSYVPKQIVEDLYNYLNQTL